MTFKEWLLSQKIVVGILRPIFWLGNYIDWIQDEARFIAIGRKQMTRIAVIGDLSLQDPKRLDKAFAAAALEKPDIIVQVGDMHPGYDVVKRWADEASADKGLVLAIPGNHDTSWDSVMGKDWPRRWMIDRPTFRMVGVDNSGEDFSDEDWKILDATPDDGKSTFVFTHKPFGVIVLPDGSENQHVMGEGSNPSAIAGAKHARDWLRKRTNTLLVSGHFHGWTFMQAPWGQCLVEGRGGAGPGLGFTIITVTPEGWAFHRVDLE